MKYSVVIAVYNRVDELDELLESLANQTDRNFEVIVVDDGSTMPIKEVTARFCDRLEILYHRQENSGPGAARNKGASLAKGDYLIFIDSDCILPPTHIATIRRVLQNTYTDFFGGPDAAHPAFSTLQKAISYSMTSWLTTGGIRGRKHSMGKFQPRSFNMGVSKKAFFTVNGFSDLRIGEDPDLSMSLWEKGFQSQLIPEAYVYHKRRNTLKSFACQVYRFGIARPILFLRHPTYIRATFFAPSIFLIYSVFSLLLSLTTSAIFALPLFLYFFFVWLDALRTTHRMKVAGLSVITSAIQWYAYGWGFTKAWILLWVLKHDPKKTFPSHFYQTISKK